MHEYLDIAEAYVGRPLEPWEIDLLYSTPTSWTPAFSHAFSKLTDALYDARISLPWDEEDDDPDGEAGPDPA